MNNLKLLPLLFFVGCTQPNTSYNIYEHTEFTAKHISSELLSDYQKMTSFYQKYDEYGYHDAYLFFVEALKFVKTAKNDKAYFKTCKTAYLELEKLTKLYNTEIDFIEQQASKSKPKVTPEMDKQKALVYQRILDCQKA